MGQWESTRRPKGIIGDDADCEELDLCPGWWTTPKVAQKEDTLEALAEIETYLTFVTWLDSY